MNTFKNYLENMFSGFPQTEKIKQIKKDLLSSMEEKYHELKHEGKTENEAIGIVISEFGNIDEIMNEFNIKKNESYSLSLTEEEVKSYIKTIKKESKKIGIGVILCIMGAVSVVLLNHLINEGIILISQNIKDFLIIIPFLFSVALAVGLFIFSGIKLERYQYIKKEDIQLSMSLRSKIEEEHEKFRPTYIRAIISGTILCILSPLSIFLTMMVSEVSVEYGVIGLLGIISLAVYLFIIYGNLQESYTTLLNK